MTDPSDPETADARADLRAARSKISRELAEVEAEIEVRLGRRNRLTTAIGQLDELIDELGLGRVDLSSTNAGPALIFSGSGNLTVGGSAQSTPTIREVVVALLQSDARPFDTREILDAVREAGIDSQEASTRSILSKMADDADGPVERVRRGVYQARRRTWGALAPAEQVTVPTPAEFMAMRSQPGDEDEEVDPDEGRLFSDEDVRGHPARGEDQPPKEATSS